MMLVKRTRASRRPGGRWAALALVVTAVALSACSHIGQPPGATAEVAGTSIDVVLGEWQLATSATELPPGVVSIGFRNSGTVAHGLRIRSEGPGPQREWRSEPVALGASGELVAELTPGTYTLDCPIEDQHGEHDALGMERTLVVRAHVTAPRAQDPTEPADEPDPARHPSEISISGFAYAPDPVRVTAGATVAWINRDGAPHTATGDGWDTGRLERTEGGAVRFEDPGTHRYACTIHPLMTGTVVVES